MPSLADHHSSRFTKVLMMGDSGTGKTGSLVSLVAAGYKLRILDFDNKLDVLRKYVLRECPDKINNVEYRSLRDRRKMTAGGSVIEGSPKAFVEGTKMLDHWKYDDIDLGQPYQWGPDTILVVDSLSRMSDAAYDWREMLAPRGKSGEYDVRAVYGDAQDAVENHMATLTSPSFETNVIVIAHVQYMDLPDGRKKFFPQGVGKALSPKFPQYFSTYILYENKNGKRTIHTSSTTLVDLFTPAPFDIDATYPIETGLASIFDVLHKQQQEAPPATNPLTTINPNIKTIIRTNPNRR